MYIERRINMRENVKGTWSSGGTIYYPEPLSNGNTTAMVGCIIIMLFILLMVLIAAYFAYRRTMEIMKGVSKGVDRLDKYKRWSHKFDKDKTDKVPVNEVDTEELEKLVKKLIKDELIHMMK